MNGRKTKRKDEEKPSPMKAEEEGRRRQGRQRMKPRKGRETADSKVTEAPKPTVRDEIDPNKALSLSNYVRNLIV